MTTSDSPRTILATPGRIERATQRASRAKAREQRQTRARPEPTAETLAVYETKIQQLTRLHCADYKRLDWHDIAGRGLVEPALPANAKELVARKALAAYRPGFFDSLLGMGADRRRRLAERVLEAAKADALIYAEAKRNADRHNLDVTLAASILALEPEAVEKALGAHLPMGELKPALEGLSLSFPGAGRLVIYLDALELDVLPDESCAMLENGKGGYVPTSASALQELHVSNICSAILRVGLETLTTLPIEAVEVVARCYLPSPRTGEFEQHPVIYVKLPYEAVQRMDIRRLEPTSAVTALGGRIDWDSTRGFAPIQIHDLKLVADKSRAALSQSAMGSGGA